MKLEQSVVDEVCRRSAEGEGVAAILRSMGIEPIEGVTYLRANHNDAILAAKAMQLAKRKADEQAAEAAKASI